MPYRIPYSVGLGPGVTEVPLREFAGKVAQVLADPRGWRKYGYEFREVPAAPGVRHIHLETAERAARLCGVPGFSCWRPGPGDIIVHLGNWLGGSKSSLPLDRYRNYLLSHEVGHSLGLDHQRCPAAECARRGLAVCPASVMQQMTKGSGAVAPCVEADWPLDPDWVIDDPARSRARLGRPLGMSRVTLAALLLVLLLVLVASAVAAVAGGPRRERPFSAQSLP